MVKSLTLRQKKRVKIQTLRKQGYSRAATAKEVGCALSTVDRWTIRAEDDTEDRKRSGRPGTLSRRDRNRVVQHMYGRRGRSYRETSRWITIKKKTLIGKNVVARALKKAGLKPYKPQKEPRITTKQKEKRVKFAKARKNHNWFNTLMTDEKEFTLYKPVNPQNVRVYCRTRSEVPAQKQVKYPPKVSVWGGISSKGKLPLQFYEGTIKQAQCLKIYKKMLPAAKKMFGGEDWTFMHDGAPAHTAKTVNKWLEEEVPEYISSGQHGEWPGNSPDCNWLENAWGIMNAEIEKAPPTSVAGLKRKIKKVWNDIPLEFMQNSANSMKKRMRTLIKNGGEYLKN